jgi:hypothetical protein
LDSANPFARLNLGEDRGNTGAPGSSTRRQMNGGIFTEKLALESFGAKGGGKSLVRGNERDSCSLTVASVETAEAGQSRDWPWF